MFQKGGFEKGGTAQGNTIWYGTGVVLTHSDIKICVFALLGGGRNWASHVTWEKKGGHGNNLANVGRGELESGGRGLCWHSTGWGG